MFIIREYFFFGRRRTLLLKFSNSISKKEKKCDSHCWHSHCCRTFFAPMSHRTAGIRTVGIRTLVSFALLTPSHCWHSHCWLRTGVVRTSVFRTLVVQACVQSAKSESKSTLIMTASPGDISVDQQGSITAQKEQACFCQSYPMVISCNTFGAATSPNVADLFTSQSME